MQIYPEDIQKAVERSRQITEDSKKLIEPAKPVQSLLDQRFEAARWSRQK